jgi:hypothetical protein
VGTVLTVLIEIEKRPYQGKRILTGSHTGKPLSISDRFWKIFTSPFVQKWFIVKKFQLGRSPALKQIYYPFNFGRVMQGI